VAYDATSQDLARTSENSVNRKFNFGKLSFQATTVNKTPPEPLIRCFIRDSSPCVPLLGVSSTPLDNASLQEASYLKVRRVKIVVRLLAESLVVVLLMALGWWGMTTLGSDSLQAMRYPTYVPECPLADRLEKGSAVEGCSKEGVSHPITSRQPGAGLSENAHGAERHREGKAPPRTSENSTSRHLSE
jgi:hypothetical protein